MFLVFPKFSIIAKRRKRFNMLLKDQSKTKNIIDRISVKQHEIMTFIKNEPIFVKHTLPCISCHQIILRCIKYDDNIKLSILIIFRFQSSCCSISSLALCKIRICNSPYSHNYSTRNQSPRVNLAIFHSTEFSHGIAS